MTASPRQNRLEGIQTHYPGIQKSFLRQCTTVALCVMNDSLELAPQLPNAKAFFYMMTLYLSRGSDEISVLSKTRCHQPQ